MWIQGGLLKILMHFSSVFINQRTWMQDCWKHWHIFIINLYQQIIIMYIYHALINALSTHMIHVNLNIIFCTHVEHSPTKIIYMKYYTEKQTPHTHCNEFKCVWHWSVSYIIHALTAHTHTRNDHSRNWVLILIGAEILWEEEGFQFGFKRCQGWAVSMSVHISPASLSQYQ